jgi:putative FmdB family regulatory protein
VPTYAYACTSCDNRFEVQQSFSDAALTECPQCQGRLRKLFNSVGIVFKGSGFYRTDSRNRAKSDASATSSADGGSGKSEASSSSSDSSSSSSSSSDSSSGSSSSSSSSSGGSSSGKSTSAASSGSAA